MKVDVKHNTSCESTLTLTHTTRDIQIKAIDHTDIRTNRQEKCRKSPTDHVKTLDQHTIHHNTPRPQIHLNRHHNPNKMKKSTKSKYKGDAQHNTTHTRSHLHKHHPQKSTLLQRPARHQQYLLHQILYRYVTNAPTNLRRS